jgi:3-oxoacyl-[acyl-carrier-protein] synthase-3
MSKAKIGSSAYYLPTQTLDNDALAALYSGWSAEKIYEKTGIRQRHIAADDETAVDLAFNAATRLFENSRTDPREIDFLLLCTQTPDYFLPSSCCVLQERLSLSHSIGSMDINLGCSGFVYCLSAAKGLIESGQASRVLILTADTYSKLIHPMDKSIRTIFSDAGAATMVTAVESDEDKISRCIYGTDGRGCDKLIVPTGAFREPRTAGTAFVQSDSSGNSRARDNLYMDGADVLAFTLREVPAAVVHLLDRARHRIEDIDYFLFHQGSRLMLDMLRKKLGIPMEKFIVDLEEVGNTVSSTIPIALSRLRQRSPSSSERTVMLIGFGVGYSWAGTIAKI